MPKERTINPAAQQRKEDKRKEIAKSKKQVQAQRNEKLAKRNPERLQRQIDDLKALEGSGALRPKDKELLNQLERDVKGIKRARDALGDAAPKFGSQKPVGNAREQQKERRSQHQQSLGKRRREDEENVEQNGSDTDPEVRAIPMPRDTPPPISRQKFVDPQVGPDGVRVPHTLPTKPVAAPAQTVYSGGPQLRDLKKEAVQFVPAAVQAHKAKLKGQGKLLEPEELDRLEKAGYMRASKPDDADAVEVQPGEHMDTDEEMRKFERELNALQDQRQPPSMNVQMDDIEDDGT